MKLLIADDHTLFRDVLVQYIERAEPGAEITAVRSFPEALTAMEGGAAYDTVLLDLQMPGMNGLEGFRTMRRIHPDVPVALMSGVAETGDVREAMALGVAGYFPKTLSGAALLKAIRQVLAGGRYVPPGRFPGEIPPSYYANGHAGKKDAPAKSDAGFGLTRREKEVLNYLVRGASNKEIANALGLQVVTIKLHVHSLCRKLGVKNRTQAALLASTENIAE
jgi:DNA-binding NarL/FixJ family response regulator